MEHTFEFSLVLPKKLDEEEANRLCKTVNGKSVSLFKGDTAIAFRRSAPKLEGAMNDAMKELKAQGLATRLIIMDNDQLEVLLAIPEAAQS